MTTEHRDHPPMLNYTSDSGFVALVEKVLSQESLVLIRDFPPHKNAFASFSRCLGPLMPSYRATGDNSADDYVQEVRIRSDTPPQERLSTERDGELKPHTAKSWAITRPELFGLLMIESGWVDQARGSNGESILVRWREVFLEMSERFPSTYEEDWLLLKSTNIIFTATHLKDSPANEPLITELNSPFDIGVRYKENMTNVIQGLIPTIPEGERYYQAVLRFDDIARTTRARYEFRMEPGDLYFVDNRRVGHARRPFQSYRQDPKGQLTYTPRFLLNIHILNVSR